MPCVKRFWARRIDWGCLAIVLIVTVVPAVLFYPMVRGPFTDADDLQFEQPEVAVRDARALIADRSVNPDKFGPFTPPDALLPSLRIENLRYAKVHADHVDLVVARDPDWSLGARIWSQRHRPHHDEPTRYREIYFFRYTHESPESLDNIP
jgi:hypothetical protein